MKLGIGLSKEREPDQALQEAYRKSLQKLKATKADLSLVFYSYDYAMDTTALSAAFKRVFRDVPNLGSSTASAWFGNEGFELETGLMCISIKDLGFEYDVFKVHSLKEKAQLWSTELSRQIHDQNVLNQKVTDFILVISDSLNFVPGEGFSNLERALPETQICGVNASYSVPQVSLLCNNEIHMNSLLAVGFRGVKPYVGLMHNVLPELNPVNVNRMSENLMIEIDDKPAFYKLSEHLMSQDDLPMMSPDQFRKHMGDLFLIQIPRNQPMRPRTIGTPHEVVSLLGSEMTTGMVAVANELDFQKIHYLGQRKAHYAEEQALKVFSELKAQCENPSWILFFNSMSRLRDRERKTSDRTILKQVFPSTPTLEIASQGEFLGAHNQFAGLAIVFP